MKSTSTCYACGKPLSDPFSVEMGIGPVCRGNRRNNEHKKRDLNVFGNRARYTWGIDGNILWLEDKGTECRSLTNDIENCLVEIYMQLPEGKKLTDYKIIYRDSDREWDGIEITEIGDLQSDFEWLKYREERGQPYWSIQIQIDFFPVREKEYHVAKNSILRNERYSHVLNEEGKRPERPRNLKYF